MDATSLTLLEFDLAYLALLTQNGIKPLSRWEGVVPHGIEEVMDKMGLELAYVRRRLQNGKSTTEFIFSKSEAHLDLYLQRFDDSLIDISIETQRLEGFLFGFPPCCVESFAHFGYRPNELEPEDQKLLFHWACPHCGLTPLLLPSYRRVHQRCVDIFAGRERSHKILSQNQKEVAKKVLAVASSLALAAAGAALYAPTSTLAKATITDDPHWLPLPRFTDHDADLLPDDDEPYLGMQPNVPDSDDNGILDGVQLAQAAYAIYAMLPHEAQSNGPYVVDHMQRGIEQCSVCGGVVNMGYAAIVNPLENLVIEVPYIAFHYMKCGGFGFDGTVHDGRVDPIKLVTLLGVNPTSVQSKPGNMPAEFVLWPCFPNPFNASTVIRYDLPSASFVRLEIYNALGQKIKTLVSAKESGGEHLIHWDATNDAGQPAPSGVYLIQLQAGKETRAHKVAVVR